MMEWVSSSTPQPGVGGPVLLVVAAERTRCLLLTAVGDVDLGAVLTLLVLMALRVPIPAPTPPFKAEVSSVLAVDMGGMLAYHLVYPASQTKEFRTQSPEPRTHPDFQFVKAL